MESTNFNHLSRNFQEKLGTMGSTINELPDELIYVIFRLLSHPALVKSSLVCKKWKNISSDFSLYTFKFNEKKDIHFLVEKIFLSNAQAAFYAPISSFIDECFRQIVKTARINQQPKQVNKYSVSWDFGVKSSTWDMPRPFIVYGEWTFQIYHQKHIKIHSEGIRWIYQSD